MPSIEPVFFNVQKQHNRKLNSRVKKLCFTCDFDPFYELFFALNEQKNVPGSLKDKSYFRFSKPFPETVTGLKSTKWCNRIGIPARKKVCQTKNQELLRAVMWSPETVILSALKIQRQNGFSLLCLMKGVKNRVSGISDILSWFPIKKIERRTANPIRPQIKYEDQYCTSQPTYYLFFYDFYCVLYMQKVKIALLLNF